MTLSALTASGLRIEIEPEAVLETVQPGRPLTRFAFYDMRLLTLLGDTPKLSLSGSPLTIRYRYQKDRKLVSQNIVSQIGRSAHSQIPG